jgi:hypothetical protein
MPGRSSSRSSFSRSSSKSTPSVTSRSSVPVSTPSHSSLASVQHNVKVEQPGFFSNMMQGFALGTGQSFAFNLFRSNPTPAPSAAPTHVSHASPATASTNSSIESSLPKEFVQCMKETNNDKDACKHYID